MSRPGEGSCMHTGAQIVRHKKICNLNKGSRGINAK